MVVGVGGVDEVVMGLFSIAEVDLIEKAGGDEMFEGAVDGCFGNAVIGFVKGEEKFFGFEGTSEFLNGLQDGEALSGIFQPVLAEKIAKDLFRTIHGGMMGAWRHRVNCGHLGAEGETD